VLHVRATQPVAHLVVRLADVAPDGSVEQVSEGILNLTHRDSHTEPEPLEPGKTYDVRVAMRAAGYRFRPGHRIQLRVASAHWPVIWPSPGAGELSILRGSATPSRLELPLAPAGTEVVSAPAFRREAAALSQFGIESSDPVAWQTIRDDAAGTVTVRTHEASTSVLPDGVSTLLVGESLVMTASDRQPGEGRFENTCDYVLDRDGHRVVVVATGTTVATQTAFEMDVAITVELDGSPFFDKAWREVIPRDLL